MGERRVLITGITGFIGESIAHALQNQGDFVVGVGRSEQKLHALRKDGFSVYSLDISDQRKLPDIAQIIDHHQIDTVIHTAAIMSAGKPQEIHDANVGGTQTVFDAAEAVGAKRFINTSSVAVYGGATTAALVGEDSPMLVTSLFPYGYSKAEAESLLLSRQEQNPNGTEIVIFRPANVYGPGSDNLWTTQHFDRIKKGGMLRIPLLVDGGKGKFNGLYIDDLTQAYARAVRHEFEDTSAHIYNLTSDDPITYKEYYEYFEEMLDSAGIHHDSIRSVGEGAARFLAPLLGKFTALNPETVQIVTNQHTVFDISRARADLGYNPQVSTEEGMKRVEKSFAGTTRLS